MPEPVFLTDDMIASYENAMLEGFRAEADANAQIPPIPKGTYVVKVQWGEEDAEKRFVLRESETSGKYVSTSVVAEIIENPLNPPDLVGRSVYGACSTLVRQSGNKGTTSMQGVIQAAGKEWADRLASLPATIGSQLGVLKELLNGGGFICGVLLDWEARLYDKEADETVFQLRGMTSFPKIDDTTYNHIVVCQEEGKFKGTEVAARAVIKRWLSLAQVDGALDAAGVEVEAEDAQAAQTAAPAPTPAPAPAAARTPAPAAAPAAPARAAAPARRPLPRG